MRQRAKFVDVTRSYIPLDPKTFPVSMHGTSREDAPEDRIPVLPYDGRNFLPTAYGYKSYFGTNRKLDINDIPGRPEFVIVHQNEFLANTLIAFTDLGIYIKKGEAIGAWTLAAASPAIPAEDLATTQFQWTYCVIENTLYAYQENMPSYYKIEGDEDDGVTVTAVTPTFLNMAAQKGIFRAGGRLGFWDSDGSIAWSNLDNLADFVPSITTLAGSSKFSDINGSIIMIRSHGAGFMVYATKSILYVRQDVSATFQWDPTPVLTMEGIGYRKQSVSAVPDTLHFVRTENGIYRITNGQAELIIPEIHDFLKKIETPVYLNLLGSRFLFFEILDPNFVNGLSEFSVNTIPPITYTFPGNNITLADAIAESQLTGSNLCQAIAGFSQGTGWATPPAPQEDQEGEYEPVYTAFFSRRGVIGPVTDWIDDPVATIGPSGTEVNMCPGTGVTMGDLSTDGTGNTEVSGAEAYIDGKWTIERFVQAQALIWELEAQSLQDFISTVKARTGTDVKLTPNYNAGSATSLDQLIDFDENIAYMERYPTRFSAPNYGFSSCEFWMTRYALEAEDIERVKQVRTQGEIVDGTYGPWGWSTGVQSSPKIYASEEAAVAAYDAATPTVDTSSWVRTGIVLQDTLFGIVYPRTTTWGPVIGMGGLNLVRDRITLPSVTLREGMTAFNYGTPVQIPPTPDTGYLRLTGWRYRDTDGNFQTVPAGICAAPSVTGDERGEAPLIPVSPVGNDGSFCSLPFQPVTIPGVEGVVTNWPEQTVTLPGGTFLLQSGSFAPVYPVIYNAFVYDLHLQKWGRFDAPYRLLLDYSPINNASNGNVPFQNFGIMGGIVDTSGAIRLFDRYPSISYITYGKIGYYRLGNTRPEEVHVHFGELSTGTLRMDTSLDGKNLESALFKIAPFTNASKASLFGAFPGAWQSLTISGYFDINYIEYNGLVQGNR